MNNILYYFTLKSFLESKETNYIIDHIAITLLLEGTRCSSLVQRSILVRWVLGSIRHDGPIELFLVLANAL